MTKILLLSFSALLLSSSIAYADDSEAAELFQEADCMSCHNNEDFHKSKEKTPNFKKMHNFVQSCQQANDAGWFDDEALEVSKYLNKKFYHFKETKID